MALLRRSLAGLLLAAAIGARAYNLCTGRDVLLDARDKARLSRRTVAQWAEFYARNPRRSDIIVCLTTTPSRITRLEGTLKSLLYQSRRPHRIRLHIPAFSRREQRAYTIPAYLETLSPVDIVRCADDGPATKLIPALQTLPPQQKILVVDDDRLYPPHLVDEFDRWSNACPRLALGVSGWRAPANLMDRPLMWVDNLLQIPPEPVKSTRLREKKPVDVLQGYTGYLVRPEFFDVERVADYTRAPEAAFYVDDVWISAHCRAPKYVFPARRHCFISRRDWPLFDRTALYRINGQGDPEKRNNTIMLRYFKDCWLCAR
jgi:hypothetical protein